MEWQFEIIDRDSNVYSIDEPVGWDALKLRLKRDPDMHGVLAEYSVNSFQF